MRTASPGRLSGGAAPARPSRGILGSVGSSAPRAALSGASRAFGRLAARAALHTGRSHWAAPARNAPPERGVAVEITPSLTLPGARARSPPAHSARRLNDQKKSLPSKLYARAAARAPL